jgi:hypothetical protein
MLTVSPNWNPINTSGTMSTQVRAAVKHTQREAEQDNKRELLDMP